jgi:predicted ribosomally synthesized peptide with nif11-like leader
MSLDSAQLFVSKMRENRDFREKVRNVFDKEALWNLVKSEGYDFDEKDLVGAMAECMSELESSCSKK